MDPLTCILAYVLVGGLVTLFEDIWGPKGGPGWVCFVMGALWPLHIVVFLGFFAHAMAKGQHDD